MKNILMQKLHKEEYKKDVYFFMYLLTPDSNSIT